MKENKYFVGKLTSNCDKTHGARNCEVYITWELKDGKFTMSGEVWNPLKTDTIMGGQCIDTIAKLFPQDSKLQRMCAIWERWHLNDMVPGSPAQMEYLRANPVTAVYPESHYDKACAALAAVGLNPDADGYKYGSAWKTEEIPDDVIAEINSWNVK